MMSQILASAGLFAVSALAQSVINSGAGFGTYYYDVEEIDACGADFSNINQGFVECSNAVPLTLDQINSNYVVAMNHTLLAGDLAAYCGRPVVVSVNGVQSNLPFFIGDGCQRCGTGSSTSTVWNPDGAPGLDFSYSALSELSSLACADGHVDITWEILDEIVYDFDTNGPLKPAASPSAAKPVPTTKASSRN